MKKWLLLILIALVVLIMVVLIFLPTGRKHIFRTGQAVVEVVSIHTGGERSLAGMVPENAGIFIRLHGFSESWDDLVASDFFKDLKRSKLWEEAMVEEKLQKFQEEFSERNGFELNRSRLMEVAGEDIALAVFPSDVESPEALVVISRVGLKARLVEIMVRWGDGLRDGDKRILREEEYRGEKINLFSPSGSFAFFGAYTFIENYLVVAISPGSVRSVIEDVIDLSRDGTGRASLKSSSDFSSALREVSFPSESFLEWYLKPDICNPGPDDDILSSGGVPAIEWGREIIKNLSGIKTVAGRVGYDRGIRFRLALELEEEIVDGSGSSLDHLQGYIPSAALLFAESEIGPTIIWEEIVAYIMDFTRQGYGAPLLGLRNWERETGVNIADEILPVLSDKWALLILGISGNEFLPITPAAVIIQVTDREKAERIMGRISVWTAATYNWRLVREEFGDSVITSAGEETDGRINLLRMLFPRPGYAFFGSELVISSSTKLLKDIIDTRNGVKAGVETAPDFREVVGVIGPVEGNFVYLNGEKVIDSLLNMGEWYLPIQRLSREKPWLPEDLFRKKIVPILNLCRIFKSVGISINYKKRLVKGDCFLYIE